MELNYVENLLFSAITGIVIGNLIALSPQKFQDKIMIFAKRFNPIYYLIMFGYILTSMMWILMFQELSLIIDERIVVNNEIINNFIKSGIVSAVLFYISVRVYSIIIKILVRICKTKKINTDITFLEKEFNTVVNTSIIIIILYFLSIREYFLFSIFLAILLGNMTDYNSSIAENIKSFKKTVISTKKQTIMAEALCIILMSIIIFFNR